MDTKDFNRIVREKHLRMIDDIAYGRIGAFPVMVFKENNVGSNGLNVVWNIPASEIKRIKTECKAVLKKYDCLFWFRGNSLITLVSGQSGNYILKFDTVVKVILDLFETNHVLPIEKCPICGKAECDSAVHIGNCYRNVHHTCVVRRYGQTKWKNFFRHGGPFWRVFGAILGAALAFIFMLLAVAYGFDYLFMPGIFYPFFIMMGYYLGGGSSKTEMFILVGTLSIFTISLLTVKMKNLGADVSNLSSWDGILLLSLFFSFSDVRFRKPKNILATLNKLE